MSVLNWFKRKLGVLSIALSNVEKGALTQTGEGLASDVTHNKRVTQGQVADSLVNGEVTQEVINLKWRTYKILKATEGLTAEIIGYDDDGMPIVRTKKRNNKRGLKKVSLDSFDTYPLEMVIDNSEIVLSGNDVMNNEHISLLDEVMLNDEAIGQTATHGTINSEEYFITSKNDRPIKIGRETLPNYYIENFTKKLNVRKISKNKRLLEFYVSKYPDDDNRTSKLFLSNVKKLINGEKEKQMFTDIQKIGFVTYKNLGVEDYLEFEYDVQSFDKIIEFNGFYVIKFIAKVVTNGKDIFEEHRVVELDKKYEQKAKK
jgi:hypothetical protein